MVGRVRALKPVAQLRVGPEPPGGAGPNGLQQPEARIAAGPHDEQRVVGQLFEAFRRVRAEHGLGRFKGEVADEGTERAWRRAPRPGQDRPREIHGLALGHPLPAHRAQQIEPPVQALGDLARPQQAESCCQLDRQRQPVQGGDHTGRVFPIIGPHGPAALEQRDPGSGPTTARTRVSHEPGTAGRSATSPCTSNANPRCQRRMRRVAPDTSWPGGVGNGRCSPAALAPAT